MIEIVVIALASSGTLITLGSLWFANRVHVRETESMKEPDPIEAIRATFQERRRVLERERGWWCSALSHSERTRRVMEYDDRLIALAAEEAKEIERLTRAS